MIKYGNLAFNSTSVKGGVQANIPSGHVYIVWVAQPEEVETLCCSFVFASF